MRSTLVATWIASALPVLILAAEETSDGCLEWEMSAVGAIVGTLEVLE